MALEHIDPYPWFLNKPLDLIVSEQLVRSRITASEWADHWRPFLGRLYDIWTAQLPARFLVSVAGPPGSGKSVFAEQLHFILDRGLLHKECHPVALPMDGFHFPNTHLQAHTRKLVDGTEIPLMTVKGQPDTIDVPRLRRHIQAMVARPEYVSWPGYSRYTHDVIPEKFKVHSSVNLVIVEGNYLLVDRGPFQGIPAMFNMRIYIDAPGPKIIANLVDRHIAGGKELDQAKDWVRRIDLPNARLVESTRHSADVIIERDADNDIASVTWKGEIPTTSARNEGTPDSADAGTAAAVAPAAPPNISAESHVVMHAPVAQPLEQLPSLESLPPHDFPPPQTL